MFEENFEKYNVKNELKQNWEVSDPNFLLVDKENASKHLQFNNSFFLIHKNPKNKIGKVKLKTLISGSGKWEVVVYIGGREFNKSTNWKERSKVTINNISQVYSTTTLDVNSNKDILFTKFVFIATGENPVISINNITYQPISEEAKIKIEHQIKLEKNKIVREKEFESFLVDRSYNEARALLNAYKKSYKKRVKALTMLSSKSNAIELLSGTAGSLGNYNQLSNPLNYNKFKNIKDTLFVNLEPIEKLYFEDQIEGNLNRFYERIKKPLDIATGIGDIFTGGAISKLINGFKSLLIKGYSPERLLFRKIKKNKIREEQNRGVKFYKECKVFFKEIDQQNHNTLALNQNLLSVYQKASRFNKKINIELQNYLTFQNIILDKGNLQDLIKNSAHRDLYPKIDKSFSDVLGTSETFNVYDISNHIKKLDIFFTKTDELIEEYNIISNALSSYYTDFNTRLENKCPFVNLDNKDEEYWNKNIGDLKIVSNELEKKFIDNYVDIEFIKD